MTDKVHITGKGIQSTDHPDFKLTGPETRMQQAIKFEKTIKR